MMTIMGVSMGLISCPLGGQLVGTRSHGRSAVVEIYGHSWGKATITVSDYAPKTHNFNI